MALPTLSKTWQYAVNQHQVLGNSSNPGYCSYVLYDLKESLIGFSSSPWTVVSSSDGTPGGTGPGDNWANGADAIHYDGGTTPGAWIVLKQTGIAPNFQMLIRPVNNSGGNQSVVEVYISENAGFTGGDYQGTRPTATDEVETWAHPNTGQAEWTDRIALDTTPGWLHVQQSSDGEITRWWLYIAGVCHTFFNIEKPRDAMPGWTIPWICSAVVDEYSGTDYRPTYGHLNDLNELTTSRAGGTLTWLYYTSEFCVDSMLGQRQTSSADLDGGSWPLFPIGLFSNYAGRVGRLGALTDIWWGATAVADGDYYPADLTRQFVQIEDLIVPWNGSTMMRA